MNLPNKLTIFRILLTFIFMYFLFSPSSLAKFLAILIFLLASFTDYYDGYLARKKNSITAFGKLMDPIADKILVLAAFLVFVEMKLMPAWMAIIIVARELLITGIRILAITNGTIIPAMQAGKHKTVSQLFAILATLVFLFIRAIMVEKNLWSNFWETVFLRTVFYLFLFATLFTLLSGMSFLYHNRDYFKEKE